MYFWGGDIERQREIQIYMEIKEREEERDGEREGEIERLIYME